MKPALIALLTTTFLCVELFTSPHVLAAEKKSSGTSKPETEEAKTIGGPSASTVHVTLEANPTDKKQKAICVANSGKEPTKVTGTFYYTLPGKEFQTNIDQTIKPNEKYVFFSSPEALELQGWELMATPAALATGDDSKTYIERTTRDGYFHIVNRHEAQTINLELRRTAKDGKVDSTFAGVKPKQDFVLGADSPDSPKFEIIRTWYQPPKAK